MVRAVRTDLADPAVSGRADPVDGVASALARVLAELVGVERVAEDSHFFTDLGADSLVMARFCARARKRAELPPVSMKDIYEYPTIRSLSRALAERSSAPDAPSAQPINGASHTTVQVADPIRGPRYFLCGALQLLVFLGYSALSGLVLSVGYEWISVGSGEWENSLHPLLGDSARDYAWLSAGSGIWGVYLRSVVFGAVAFVGMCTLPVVAKWLLIGRWKPRRIRIWSLGYVRFWLVKTLVRTNPLVLFAGSPLYVLYLRALGARIGPGVVIFSRNVPVCTDLLTIGAGSVLRKEAFFLCYRAEGGWIETGAVTLGEEAFVGEKSVLDINTSMGRRAQLGHASALHAGQAVPDGERWHGSPGQPATTVDYLAVPPRRCGRLRRFRYGAVQVLVVLAVYVPILVGGMVAVVSELPRLARLLGSGVLLAAGTTLAGWDSGTPVVVSWSAYLGVGAGSVVLFLGSVLTGLLVAGTLPRLLARLIRPGRVYPLYGFHYRLHRVAARLTNLRFFTTLFGDSSYIVHYLRYLGYDLSQVQQTGSNFGGEVVHETPFHAFVGTGTMVADGLSIVNAEFSSTSFRVSRAAIGPRNFLGNDIAYPAGGRTGDNCLLATKVMVPLDGEVREGVGLLGSPCFEIPRSVERDGRFDNLRTGEEFRRRLAAKNRFNIRSMLLYLFVRWLNFVLVTELALVTVNFYGALANLAVAAFLVLSTGATAGYYVLVERAFTAFRPLRSRFCSIYDPYFWWHERMWKVPFAAYFRIFDGTPFKTLVWRLQGVRIGHWVFDDGCYITERTLVTIGNGCALNMGSKIQCHSQEDGTFKSDHSTVGAGATVGVHALVHYGVTMGEAAVLAPDSFLMKGEEVPPGARWGGNPARQSRDGSAFQVVDRVRNNGRARRGGRV